MKLFVKLLTAVAAIVCFSAPEATAFGTTPAKRMEAISAAYTNYTHAYTTGAPNVSDMLSKLNKVCNSNCTSGLGKFVKGTCANTKLRETCAKRCHSSTAKKCLAKFKETQVQYLARDKRKLDEHGIPMSPSAMKKAHDAASAHLAKTKATVADTHKAHVAHKAATVKERADFRKAAKTRTKAAFQSQAPAADEEEDDNAAEGDDADSVDGDSTAGGEDDAAPTEEETTDDQAQGDDQGDAAPEEEEAAPAPVRKQSVKKQPVYQAPAEVDSFS